MTVWFAVAVAGGLGALARAWVGRTFVVNMSGAFVLGLLAGAGVDGDTYLIAGAGFLGAYTTFSAWMLDAHEADSAPRVLGGSLALGLVAAAVGHALGSAL